MNPTDNRPDDMEDDEARVFHHQNAVYKGVPKKHHVLKKPKTYEFCNAKRFPGEGPAFYCTKGKVNIYIPELPAEQRCLFANQTDRNAKYFQKHIRYFNSHFSFTSFGVFIDHNLASARGTSVYYFRAPGQIYHSIFVDQRRYNAPGMDQFAAIWVDGNDPQQRFSHSIIIYGTGGGSRRHVSMREYYCFKLQIHEGQFNMFFHAGRLFRQFAVDMYVKVESMHLDWYVKLAHQAIICADLYQGILDTLTTGDADASKVGLRVVLSKDFPGSGRDVQSRFMGAMTLVTRYGKPNFFVTMTCNPYWDEIVAELLPGQTPQDRPDVVARVYHAKLPDLQDFLIKKGHLGKVAAWAHVTEFQKRGLPHEHFLLVMEPRSKLKSYDEYDKYISAELPDKKKYPELHNLICKHMMHGPCGVLNKDCPCIVDVECRFPYSYQFNKKDVQKVKVQNEWLDNRWVVPYNPVLLMRSMLTEYFKVSRTNPAARKYLYREFPEHFTWNKSKKLVYANPAEGERYYLRIMLNHVRGATSYENLRTWHDNHLDSVSEYFRCTCDNSLRVEQMVLRDISCHLTSMGKDIRHYGLSELHKTVADHYRELTEEQNLRFDEDNLKILDILNAEQMAGYEEILDHVLNSKGQAFFVDGPGGTGETYLYKALIAKVWLMDLIVIASATSGIAASIMPGGRTAHFQFKIPIKLSDNTMCSFTKASLIIWDEVAMTKRQLVETLDRSLRDIMDCDKPFGGKVMFGGDFRQVQIGTRAQITDATLLRSYIWESAQRIRLTQNMRAQADTEKAFHGDYVCLPNDILIQNPPEDDSIDILMDHVFPDLIANCTSATYMREHTILSTRNEHVDTVNALMIDRFPGKQKVFYSFDSANDDSHNNYPLDFINLITPNGLPP
ncbi:hypothetical protein GQ55_7G026400 [Panicum hallii var. hallii]|uniref:ATP-dependent DNA helicase n=1 Tax=Panicum hallii var. hallii TaxID=1504633 RepID=A0A2T7CS46_9POAL|nr:hypothetical protein GQ55_7G026400 [Panicum hallii var. hallii]